MYGLIPSIINLAFAGFVLWRTTRLAKSVNTLSMQNKVLSTSYGHLRSAVTWAAQQGVVLDNPDELVSMYLSYQTKLAIGGLYKRPVQ